MGSLSGLATGSGTINEATKFGSKLSAFGKFSDSTLYPINLAGSVYTNFVQDSFDSNVCDSYKMEQALVTHMGRDFYKSEYQKETKYRFILMKLKMDNYANAGIVKVKKASDFIPGLFNEGAEYFMYCDPLTNSAIELKPGGYYFTPGKNYNPSSRGNEIYKNVNETVLFPASYYGKNRTDIGFNRYVEARY